MKTTVLIFLLCFCVFSSFCQPAKDAEVWANAEALNKAIFETKDSAAIQNLVSDAVTYGHSTGLLENKEAMLHNSISGTDVYKNILQERLGINYVGKTALVRYILRAQVIKNGTSGPLNINILQVWAKEHGKWKLFARQAVKVEPKQ